MEHRKEHFLKTSPLHKKLSTSRILYTSLIMLSFLLSLTLPACKKQQPAPLKTKALSVAHPDYRDKYTGTYTVQCFTYFSGYGQYYDSSFIYQLTVEKAKKKDQPDYHRFDAKSTDSSVIINRVKRMSRGYMNEWGDLCGLNQSGYHNDQGYHYTVKFRNDSLYYESRFYQGSGTSFVKLTGCKI
jgi:hypothetical protein